MPCTTSIVVRIELVPLYMSSDLLQRSCGGSETWLTENLLTAYRAYARRRNGY